MADSGAAPDLACCHS